MSRAEISDPQVIRDFRLRLSGFLKNCTAALSGVPGEFARVQDWLRVDQQGYWKKQLQRREELFNNARLAWLEAESDVRSSRNGRGGGRQSSDEERIAMIKAQRRRDEAEEKLAAVRRWILVLEQDGTPLVHQCRNHELSLQEQGAHALTELDRLADRVDDYLQIRPGSTGLLPSFPGVSPIGGTTGVPANEPQDVPAERRGGP